MTKTMKLELLGFFLARVLISQSGNQSWNSAQSAFLPVVDLQDHQQCLSLDMNLEKQTMNLTNRNAD
jgi:hypothetical protein